MAGMSLARRLVLIALALAAGCGRPPEGGGPLEPTRANVIHAAQQVMRSARFCALVTVDAEGQPRARTVAPLPPLEGDGPLTVWIATRPSSRKVVELRAEPRVVLYYFDAQRLEYATVSGRARLVGDLSELNRRREHVSEELYPDWPEDCLLIEVQPTRVEVQGRQLAPDPLTWQPAGVDLDPARSPPPPASR